jgi:hypothetical protein
MSVCKGVEAAARAFASESSGSGDNTFPPPPQCLQEQGRFEEISVDVSGDDERQ